MAYNRRKRKIKKNIPEAEAHIHSTYNNTIVTIIFQKLKHIFIQHIIIQ